MWVAGGGPDHAIIGRFINMHSEFMTGAFFASLTRVFLKKTKTDGRCLAGDGTVIEAACSSYNLSRAVKASIYVFYGTTGLSVCYLSSIVHLIESGPAEKQVQ